MASQLFSFLSRGQTIFLTILMAGIFFACSSLDPQVRGTRPVSHALFDTLLKKHVKENGLVDYAAWKNDQAQLKQYLDILTLNPPNDNRWTQEEKLAYWINLYNAFTIDLILQYYPVASIKDIGSSIQVPFVNTPWDIKFIDIAGKKYDLNNIEHNIIRKNFNEPRIHFAVNCASISCPKLRREAYTGEKLNHQLDEQTKDFLNDKVRNDISEGQVKVSKLFKWYRGDFVKETSLREFLRKSSGIAIREDRKILYMDYNWSLNEAKD